MSNLHNNKDFIEGVWKKARYLEYTRTLEEKKEQESVSLRKRKYKSLLTFGLGLVLVAVPLLVTGSLSSEFAASLIGIYMMSFALYYEYNF